MGTLRLPPLTSWIPGMDSSVWEDIKETPAVPNFSLAYHNGLQFNYLKASQGLFTDRCFYRDWANCRKTPLRIGPYHFLEWTDGRKQAEYFMKVIEKDPGDLRPITDFEWWSTIPSRAFDILYNFGERFVQLFGKFPGIYTAKSFWDQYGTKTTYWKNYPLWLAHYDMTPPTAKDIPLPWTEVFAWQCSGRGDGKHYGMEALDVDMDYIPQKQWEELFGSDNTNDDAEPPTPPTPPEPPIPDPDPKPTEDYEMKMLVLATVLNVRLGPGTNFPIVGTKKLNDQIIVHNFMCTANGSWVQISDNQEWCCVRNSVGEYLRKI